jgi:hypothetical protein
MVEGVSHRDQRVLVRAIWIDDEALRRSLSVYRTTRAAGADRELARLPAPRRTCEPARRRETARRRWTIVGVTYGRLLSASTAWALRAASRNPRS